MKPQLLEATPHLRAFAACMCGSVEVGDSLVEQALTQTIETHQRGVAIADPGWYAYQLLQTLVPRQQSAAA